MTYDSYMNGHFKKKHVSIFFGQSFDKNKIENCGFHSWKEKIKTHRIVYYRTLWPGFFKGFQPTFLKTNLLRGLLTVNFQLSGVHENRQSKIYKTTKILVV